MISLVVALMLTSPAAPREPACDEQGFPVASVKACRASCSWWSRAETRCRDVDMEVIGAWDARPAPADWPGTVFASPADWPAFPLEKANAP